MAQLEKNLFAQTNFEWIWKKSAVDFDEMTNLSMELRAKLKAKYIINPVKYTKCKQSVDGNL